MLAGAKPSNLAAPTRAGAGWSIYTSGAFGRPKAVSGEDRIAVCVQVLIEARGHLVTTDVMIELAWRLPWGALHLSAVVFCSVHDRVIR